MSKKENSPSQSLKERSIKARKRRSKTPKNPFERLCEYPKQINPAIILAEQLMRKDVAETLNFDDLELVTKTLEDSRREIKTVEIQLAALVKTPCAASEKIPVGF